MTFYINGKADMSDLAGYPLAFGLDDMGEEITPIQRMIFEQMNGLRNDLQDLSKELKNINAFIDYTKGENLRGQIAAEVEQRKLLESRLSLLEQGKNNESGAKGAMKIAAQVGAWIVGTVAAYYALFKK